MRTVILLFMMVVLFLTMAVNYAIDGRAADVRAAVPVEPAFPETYRI
jgi:hypothetical protein